jgi:hypothetical protein
LKVTRRKLHNPDPNQDPDQDPDPDPYRVWKCHGSATLDDSMCFVNFWFRWSSFGFEFICGFRFSQEPKLRKRCYVWEHNFLSLPVSK